MQVLLGCCMQLARTMHRVTAIAGLSTPPWQDVEASKDEALTQPHRFSGQSDGRGYVLLSQSPILAQILNAHAWSGPEVAQGARQVGLLALGEHACQLALRVQVAHVRKPLVVQHLLVPGGAPALPAGRSQAPSVSLRR